MYNASSEEMSIDAANPFVPSDCESYEQLYRGIFRIWFDTIFRIKCSKPLTMNGEMNYQIRIMHRNKKTILAVLLSFISASPITGASTMLVKPTVSVANVTGMAAASIAVVKLIKYLLRPPKLAELVIGYCQPNNVLSFEITPDSVTTQTSDGKTHTQKTYTQKGPWLPDPHRPFVRVYKPYAWCPHDTCKLGGECPNPGMGFFISYCYAQKYHEWYYIMYKDSGPILISDTRISLTDSPHYKSSLNSVPLQHNDRCIIQKTKALQSYDVAIVDCDEAGRGTKIVGRIYDTQDMVTWKALEQALATPTELSLPELLPAISDSSSSSSSAMHPPLPISRALAPGGPSLETLLGTEEEQKKSRSTVSARPIASIIAPHLKICTLCTA